MMRGIEEEIARSMKMLDLKNDWDDNGSIKIDANTFQRAADFLRKISEHIRDTSGCQIDTPSITPGSDGAVDIHWNRNHYELLISFYPNGFIGFYGDNKSSDDNMYISIEGKKCREEDCVLIINTYLKMFNSYPKSKKIGASGHPECPNCGNSMQNAFVAYSAGLLRCASCKTVFCM